MQPILILLSFSVDLESCTWAVTHHPETTAAAFLPLMRWGKAVAGATFPLSIVHQTGLDAVQEDTLVACKHVYSFLFVFTAYALPAFILWKLEKHAWNRFITMRIPLNQLTWPGGPRASEMADALTELWTREGSVVAPEPFWEDSHAAMNIYLAAIMIWRVLELVI